MEDKKNILYSYRTRSQVLKNKDDLIKEYELKIKELENSNKTYDMRINKLQIKLVDQEKIIKTLTDEQDDNCQEFEKICKEVTKLKKLLAVKEAETTELQTNLFNLSGLNQSLVEENDEIFLSNNLTIKSLKAQLNKAHEDYDSLRLHNDSKEKESVVINNINMPTYSKQKNKHLTKRIKKQNKIIKTITDKYQKIKKDIENLLKSINIKEQLNSIETKYNNKEFEKYISQLKMKSCLVEERNVLKDLKKPNAFEQKKSNILQKEETAKIIIVGDRAVSGIALKLKDKGVQNISSNIYINAPLKHIIQSAQNIIENTQKIILVMALKDFKEEELGKYPYYIEHLYKKAFSKNIVLIVTNLPYYKETNIKSNEIIERVNLKLNQMSKFSENIYIINISHINVYNIQKMEYNKMLIYFLQKFVENQKIFILNQTFIEIP